MKKKENLSERFEFRLTKKQLYRLKIRARLYSDGDASELIRYWIENGPIPLKEKKNELHQTNVVDPRGSGE